MDCSPPGSSVHGNSLDKNAGVGCHALLQGIFSTQGLNPGLLHCRRILYCLSHQGSPKLEKEGEVAQSWLTLCDPVDCSLPGSSIHGILQARVLEWVTISFSRGSSWPRGRTQVSRIAGRCFTLWATKKARGAIKQKCDSEHPSLFVSFWRECFLSFTVKNDICWRHWEISFMKLKLSFLPLL